MKYSSAILLIFLLSPAALLRAAPQDDPAKANDQAPAAGADERFMQLEKTLANVKLIGNFTVTGREDGKLSKEEYTITSAKKLPQGDLWLLQTRIQYGGKDVSLPLPLEIKWAGDTPVITLTDLQIPGLGVFSSRVVIDKDKYAGTWKHGDVGGHLFGVIEKIAEEEKEEK